MRLLTLLVRSSMLVWNAIQKVGTPKTEEEDNQAASSYAITMAQCPLEVRQTHAGVIRGPIQGFR